MQEKRFRIRFDGMTEESSEVIYSYSVLDAALQYVEAIESETGQYPVAMGECNAKVMVLDLVQGEELPVIVKGVLSPRYSAEFEDI